MKLSLEAPKKIDYTTPNPRAIYIRPNGIDAPWEMIDGCEFEPIEFFDTREKAVTTAIDQARLGRFTIYEADINDIIVAVYNIQAP